MNIKQAIIKNDIYLYMVFYFTLNWKIKILKLVLLYGDKLEFIFSDNKKL